MPKVFEVGKSYRAEARVFDPIFILKRTDKSIKVRRGWATLDTSGGHSWMMRIKKRPNGDEYAVDSTLPMGHRDTGTYDANWVD